MPRPYNLSELQTYKIAGLRRTDRECGNYVSSSFIKNQMECLSILF